MLRKVITLQCFRRVGYLKRVLDALEQCYGIEDYLLMVYQAWDEARADDCRAVFDLVKRWNVTPMMRHVENPPLGGLSSKLFMMREAFAFTDFSVNLEDDTVPARDFLRFMEWGNAQFRDDPSVMCLSGWSNSGVRGMEPSARYECFAAIGFNYWGMGLWKDRQQAVWGDGRAIRQWGKIEYEGAGDHWATHWVREHPERGRMISPTVARVQNIGAEDGVHTVAAEFYRTNDYNAQGAWGIADLPDPGLAAWRLV